MKVQSIIVHRVEDTNRALTVGKINELYVSVIERCLNQSALTAAQRLWVVDRVIDNLKSREVNGRIK